jgi:hypothetical protein
MDSTIVPIARRVGGPFARISLAARTTRPLHEAVPA